MSEPKPSSTEDSAIAPHPVTGADSSAGHPPQEDAPRKSRTFMWVVVAWGVLLLGLAVWSAMRGDATVREQTTVDSAKKTIDSVADRLDSAVPTGWSVVDEGYQEQSCELTLSRDGVEVRRTLAFTGPTGSEPATLSQLASTLDGAVIRPGEGTPESFYYDAGNYVGVRGKVDSSGTIRVALDSGCRAR